MKKPTPMQKVFASDWPMRVMLLPCFVLIPLFVFYLTISTLLIPLQTFELWESVLLFLFFGILSIMLGIFLGLLGGFSMFIFFIMPLHYLRGRLNGAPFYPGDRIQILSGANKGEIAHICDKMEKGFLRVELAQDALSEGEDVFSPYQLLKENVAEPTAQPNSTKYFYLD